MSPVHDARLFDSLVSSSMPRQASLKQRSESMKQGCSLSKMTLEARKEPSMRFNLSLCRTVDCNSRVTKFQASWRGEKKIRLPTHNTICFLTNWFFEITQSV